LPRPGFSFAGLIMMITYFSPAAVLRNETSARVRCISGLNFSPGWSENSAARISPQKPTESAAAQLASSGVAPLRWRAIAALRCCVLTPYRTRFAGCWIRRQTPFMRSLIAE
jgi:hypothetical protein